MINQDHIIIKKEYYTYLKILANNPMAGIWYRLNSSDLMILDEQMFRRRSLIYRTIFKIINHRYDDMINRQHRKSQEILKYDSFNRIKSIAYWLILIFNCFITGILYVIWFFTWVTYTIIRAIWDYPSAGRKYFLHSLRKKS